MRRLRFCEFKDDACNDKRCKMHFCFLAHEERKREAAKMAAEREEIRKKALVLGEQALKDGGVRNPTYAQIRAAAAHPNVFALAKKRVAEDRELKL